MTAPLPEARVSDPEFVGFDEASPARRRGVRRPAADPRTDYIRLRMTPARKEQVRAAATATRMTMTDYLLRNEAGSGARRQAPITAGDPIVLAKVLAELGKWGSNWNQLARDRNMRGQEPEAAELRHIREALCDMRDALMQALGR